MSTKEKEKMVLSDLYGNHPKQYLAVDCVIFGYEDYELKLLLHRRPIQPQKGGWSLMGGFCGNEETLEMAAKRVLEQTTGLTDIYLEQVAAFSKPDRDPAARVVSVAFYALIRIDQHDEEKVKNSGAQWWSINEIPPLIFDHQEIVSKAKERLQMKASLELVGRELLPEKFTLMQLRRLYEAIYQRELDPGNFRKKVLSLNVLEKTNTKNTTESKKGAFNYRFRDNADELNGHERVVKL
ncbi:NUDIX hydrolase [Anaerophaga thermohalophila]|jgi:ADP-ribose pyrophosphatase YjhB (NUDIX family)|uniref:NUDIX hydrolase n=1 Tax=Anaerophaga thermohalophila TaxID=177400 RepID=UPI0002FE5335|nr:NUDIX domain-containing protein [Anaerophaga thermohalophila]